VVSKFEVIVEVKKEVVDVVVSWMVGYSHNLGKKGKEEKEWKGRKREEGKEKGR
jgi:hypothetical protein